MNTEFSKFPFKNELLIYKCCFDRHDPKSGHIYIIHDNNFKLCHAL